MPHSLQQRRTQIAKAIDAYASAYSALETLQELEGDPSVSDSLLPRHGDQKTGLIGEYWAIRYARTLHPKCDIVFAGTSQKAWDLKISTSRATDRLVQVKTTSFFSNTGRLSPIHMPRKHKNDDSWDELWILQLDKSLSPVGFWHTCGDTFEKALKDHNPDVNASFKLAGVTIPKEQSAPIRPAWFAPVLTPNHACFRTALGLSSSSH